MKIQKNTSKEIKNDQINWIICVCYSFSYVFVFFCGWLLKWLFSLLRPFTRSFHKGNTNKISLLFCSSSFDHLVFDFSPNNCVRVVLQFLKSLCIDSSWWFYYLLRLQSYLDQIFFWNLLYYSAVKIRQKRIWKRIIFWNQMNQ